MDVKRRIYVTPSGKEYVVIDNKKHYLGQLKIPPEIIVENGKRIARIRRRHNTLSNKQMNYGLNLKPKYKGRNILNLKNHPKKHIKKQPIKYDGKYDGKYDEFKSKTPSLKYMSRNNQIEEYRNELQKIIKHSEQHWHQKRPKTKQELEQLYYMCNDKCFIDKEPICQIGNYCEPDCDALLHVKRKYKNTPAADMAYNVAESMQCGWVEFAKPKTFI